MRVLSNEKIQQGKDSLDVLDIVLPGVSLFAVWVSSKMIR